MAGVNTRALSNYNLFNLTQFTAVETRRDARQRPPVTQALSLPDRNDTNTRYGFDAIDGRQTIAITYEPMSLSGPKPVQRFFKTTTLKQPLVIFGALAVLSAPLRLFHLQEPLTGEHEIRQTQTALSVWEIREHGFSLLHPKLPLFGPPWECPFEYPVFQSAAAAVDCIAPWSNLDVSIRVTNVAFYYLTAVALYLLTQLILAETEALFTAAIFLFSAYNAFWSRTAMIEYAATFFGLAYLVSFIRWTFSPTRTLFVVSLCFGILGCLTKATSFVIPLFVAGILA